MIGKSYEDEHCDLIVEIERLRAALEDHRELHRKHLAELVEQRDAIIEECAKVVDKFDLLDRDSDDVLADVARAIRALKD